MTAYVSNQPGDVAVAANWTPNGVPGVGDHVTISHAMTSSSPWVVGDAIAHSIQLDVGGSLVLGGVLVTQPNGFSGIHMNGGSFNDGGNTWSHAPFNNTDRPMTFANGGPHSYVGTGALIGSTGNGATVPAGIQRPNGAAYSINFDWDGLTYKGFGSGFGSPGLELDIAAGSSFDWNGGAYAQCGQIFLARWNGVTCRVNLVALVAFTGIDWTDHFQQGPIRLNNGSGDPKPQFTNCLVHESDGLQNFALASQFMGGWDFTGTTFVNFGVNNWNSPCTFDQASFVQTDIVTEGNELSFGIAVDDTTPASISANDVCLLVDSPNNYHPLSVSLASASTIENVFNGWIVDGMGLNNTLESGDLITHGYLKFTNYMQVHGGGSLNPSLGTTGRVSIDRGTFHNAYQIYIGESASNAHAVGDLKNIIVSSMKGSGALVAAAGGAAVVQTEDAIDYIGYIEAEMDAANEDHPNQVGDGYIASDAAGDFTGYGVNDVPVADVQFVNPNANALTWTAANGYAATLAGLDTALLAGYGVDSSGDSVPQDADATMANYRAYMQASYISTNASFAGAGELGVDIGAMDVQVNQSADFPLISSVANIFAPAIVAQVIYLLDFDASYQVTTNTVFSLLNSSVVSTPVIDSQTVAISPIVSSDTDILLASIVSQATALPIVIQPVLQLDVPLLAAQAVTMGIELSTTQIIQVDALIDSSAQVLLPGIFVGQSMVFPLISISPQLLLPSLSLFTLSGIAGYTSALNIIDQFGDDEIGIIASKDADYVSGDLLRATVQGDDRSQYSSALLMRANAAYQLITQTIAAAERLIDSYLSPRYTLPLPQNLVDNSPLLTYCNHIVRFMLMDDRTTDEVDKRYDQAMKWLRDVSMNKASLGADDTAVASSAGRMVSRRGRSKLNWDGF